MKRMMIKSNNNNHKNNASYGRLSYNNSNNTTSSSAASRDEEFEWEMRPGGMLVQKRIGTSTITSTVPNFRLRIAFGALRYEISVNSQATFGEVKKLVSAESGLEPGEQKLIFRGKERENGEYLDTCGVKDGSKVILIEDPTSIEKRFIERRKNAKIQTVHRAISDVSMEIDKYAEQVSEMEKSISSGIKVSELQITTLIEMLMRQAIKLDNIQTEGETAAQKNLQGMNLQGKRVQKIVETLDAVKISNGRLKHVVVTNKWETFNPNPPATTSVAANSTTATWEIFD
ncbi:BAG family molecular chaperone regulator 3 isoform X1 [Cannabis sativa]|uniref:BAG family molecular chaperone regulator 3 isoform X1 n=1 Tax=Cannabis sativa TaxID=3483 RepID=UPI0011DFE96D|nr:BAG family molecular chaperone regulator 3 isoform X1 [Cannabis sativa]